MLDPPIHSEAAWFRDVGLWGVVVAEIRDMSGSSGGEVRGSVLSNVMSAMGISMGAESMAKATRSADRMISSAKSGGFRVTKEAADPIIKVLEEYIDQIDGMKGQLDVFNQEPKLGDHDYGRLVARHMQEAANDEKSGRVALNSLQEVLKKSREALLRASDQYQEQEESAQGTFRGVGE